MLTSVPAPIGILRTPLTGDASHGIVASDITMPAWLCNELLTRLFPLTATNKNARVECFDFNGTNVQNTLSQLEACLLFTQKTQWRLTALLALPANESAGHAVSVSYEPDTNAITYRDPAGHDVPDFLGELFERQTMQSFHLENPIQAQQQDDTSCAYITF